MDLFFTVAVIAGACYILTLVSWLFYVALMNLKRVRNDLHPFAKFNTYLLLGVGFPLDVVLNAVVGSMLFLESPKEWLLTSRLQRHKRQGGWRGDVSRWMCEHLLNQFDSGHC
jgi:hypothetical protein